MLEGAPEEQQLTYELTQYALCKPALARVARAQYELHYASAARFLDEVATMGDTQWTVAVPTLARYVTTVIDGAVLAWIVDRDRKKSLAVLDQLVDHFVTLARPTGRSA